MKQIVEYVITNGPGILLMYGTAWAVHVTPHGIFVDARQHETDDEYFLPEGDVFCRRVPPTCETGL
jgi:hypothetical protein